MHTVGLIQKVRQLGNKFSIRPIHLTSGRMKTFAFSVNSTAKFEFQSTPN